MLCHWRESDRDRERKKKVFPVSLSLNTPGVLLCSLSFHVRLYFSSPTPATNSWCLIPHWTRWRGKHMMHAHNERHILTAIRTTSNLTHQWPLAPNQLIHFKINSPWCLTFLQQGPLQRFRNRGSQQRRLFQTVVCQRDEGWKLSWFLWRRILALSTQFYRICCFPQCGSTLGWYRSFRIRSRTWLCWFLFRRVITLRRICVSVSSETLQSRQAGSVVWGVIMLSRPLCALLGNSAATVERVNPEENCIKYREPLRPPCKRSKRPSKMGVEWGWGVPDEGFFYIKIQMARFV